MQGIKAREILHANMEKIIEEKMERQQTEEDYQDAFDLMLSGAKEQGQELTIQELKVPAECPLRFRNQAVGTALSVFRINRDAFHLLFKKEHELE